MATVRTAQYFNPEYDAEQLSQSFLDANLRVKEIAYILSNRSNAQRVAIRDAYQALYKQPLEELWQTKGALPDKHTRLLAEQLIMAGGETDAELLHQSMAGIGTDELKLMEVLYSRSWDQIQAAKIAYEKGHGRTLEKRISMDVSGHFNQLLQRIVTVPRETAPADKRLATKDAERIYQAGDGRRGTNEEEFIDVFCSRSLPHLALVCDIYDAQYKSIEKSIKTAMAGDFEKALLFMVDFARNQGSFQAMELAKALSSRSLSSADKDTLICVIVGHCDTDLRFIESVFQEATGKSLAQAIQEKADGDLRTMLLTLV